MGFIKSKINQFINWWDKEDLLKAKQAIYDRCLRIIRNKLNREDIIEIGIAFYGYYTEEYFNTIKNAVKQNTLNEVDKKKEFNFFDDIIWCYQVVLSDNSYYLLIFSDPYQDPWGPVKEYMGLEYFGKIETPIEINDMSKTKYNYP